MIYHTNGWGCKVCVYSFILALFYDLVHNLCETINRIGWYAKYAEFEPRPRPRDGMFQVKLNILIVLHYLPYKWLGMQSMHLLLSTGPWYETD